MITCTKDNFGIIITATPSASISAILTGVENPSYTPAIKPPSVQTIPKSHSYRLLPTLHTDKTSLAKDNTNLSLALLWI